MAFKDLAEFQLVEPLVLPIHGTDYVFPGDISARGLDLLQRLNHQIECLRLELPVDAAEEVSDEQMERVEQEMFGDARERMLEDGRLASELKAVFWTLMQYHLAGREAAEAYWNHLGEALTPARKPPRAGGSPASSKPRKQRSSKGRPGTRSSPTES